MKRDVYIYLWKETSLPPAPITTSEINIMRNLCIRTKTRQRDFYIHEKRRIYSWKETHLFTKRDLPCLCLHQKQMSEETYAYEQWPVKEIDIFIKRDVYMYENRRMYSWKEASLPPAPPAALQINIRRNLCIRTETRQRDLYIHEKRRTLSCKETFIFMQRDLITSRTSNCITNKCHLLKKSMHTNRDLTTETCISWKGRETLYTISRVSHEIHVSVYTLYRLYRLYKRLYTLLV